MNSEGRFSGSFLTPGRLAWLLVRYRTELMDRWTHRVLEDPALPDASRLSRPALDDNIPELIDRLLARLARHPAEGWGERMGREVGGSGAAVTHARHRAAVHYTLVEALRELSHFRAVILELCHENAVVVSLDEATLLHATIDELMSTSAGELEKASLRKHEEAMGVVAHDLRTPLNVIAMYAACLVDGRLVDSKRVGEALGRSARRMARLIEDLLTLSKLEAGHFAVEAKETDVRSIVREAYEQFRSIAERRRIDFGYQIPEHELRLVCDAGRILQALGNLIANALKFTPEGGHVQLELRAGTDRCIFQVSDTGPGVPPEHVDDVFRLFWQAPAKAKDGVGLGLAIARAIVEAHGGTITVESTPGAGAKFAFGLLFSGTPKATASLDDLPRREDQLARTWPSFSSASKGLP
jgi:signal transduction histidine kinase